MTLEARRRRLAQCYDDHRTMGASTVIHPAVEELQLPKVMDALADPVRLAIVRALAAEGEIACGTLELGVSPATRSHHFRVLREAGVTYTRPVGTYKFVSLRRDELDERFPGLLGAVLTAAEREAA
jgi:DNA-binding transcriptional ArsR family regulator